MGSGGLAARLDQCAVLREGQQWGLLRRGIGLVDRTRRISGIEMEMRVIWGLCVCADPSTARAWTRERVKGGSRGIGRRGVWLIVAVC